MLNISPKQAARAAYWAAAINLAVPCGAAARLARWLSAASRPFSRLGSGLGCVQAEVRDDAGRTARAALLGDGQRLAILPCAHWRSGPCWKRSRPRKGLSAPGPGSPTRNGSAVWKP